MRELDRVAGNHNLEPTSGLAGQAVHGLPCGITDEQLAAKFIERRGPANYVAHYISRVVVASANQGGTFGQTGHGIAALGRPSVIPLVLHRWRPRAVPRR